jgi:peptidoglycan/LPS O-acetylase OafA/YrhL
VLPIGFILTGALSGKLNFNGGMNVQALVYSIWKPFVCFGICLALLVYFQKRWNFSNRLTQHLSNTAYTVYMIHPPIVVGWTLLFHQVKIPEFIKFLVVAPASVVTCFVIAYAICKLPYAKKVL